MDTDLARTLFGEASVTAIDDGTHRHTYALDDAEAALRFLQERLPAEHPGLATLGSAVKAARALHDLRTAPAFIRHAEAAREFAAIMRRLGHARRSRGWRRHVRRRKAGLA